VSRPDNIDRNTGTRRKPGPLGLTGRFLLDLVEIHIPTAVFALLFGVFILQIVFRYFFRPLTWPEELALIAFIWTALLGGLYAKREDKHVVFSVIYDSVSPTIQRWMRLIGNSLLLVAFAIALAPSWDYVSFMAFKKSNVLRIPMNVAFLPFIIFLVFMIGRLAVDIYRDIRKGGTP
jgi:TRAP-type C4-dicarboxylate transport system permease small subunit